MLNLSLASFVNISSSFEYNIIGTLYSLIYSIPDFFISLNDLGNFVLSKDILDILRTNTLVDVKIFWEFFSLR